MPQRSKGIVQISDPILALISLFIAYVVIWQHSPYYDHSLFTTRRSLEDCCLDRAAGLLLAWCILSRRTVQVENRLRSLISTLRKYFVLLCSSLFQS